MGHRAPGAARPHILVILTDQHRFDCIGCAGNPDIRTPHIDRLAAGGVRYTEAFCPSPICTPSRYSLLMLIDLVHRPIIKGSKEGAPVPPWHSFPL
ncbi:MAG: sulfatase-like hydrolase/transferase [Planctomycetota bacterium]